MIDPSHDAEVPAGRASPAPGNGPTVAITYGTYDLFHVGHVRLFRRIKSQFDRLVVAVSTDEFNALKGKRSAMSFGERIELVGACRYVDFAFPETSWEQKPDDIRRFGCTAFVMGDDWQGRFDYLGSLCQVIYLPRTEGISSTLVKANVVASSRPVESALSSSTWS